MLPKKKSFIRLSNTQEYQVLIYHQQTIEKLWPLWQVDGVSEQTIQKEKALTLESARIYVYSLGCVARIHKMLERNYEKAFASLSYKIDQDLDNLEGAQQLTDLVVNIQNMLNQGTTQEAIQEVINPFTSECWKPAIAASGHQRLCEQQQDEKNREPLKQQLVEAQAQLAHHQIGFDAVSSSGDFQESLVLTSSVTFSNQSPGKDKDELHRAFYVTEDASVEQTNQERRSNIS